VSLSVIARGHRLTLGNPTDDEAPACDLCNERAQIEVNGPQFAGVFCTACIEEAMWDKMRALAG
jgi:hypothetical protein